ncbi:MAG TPA: hypothetical protein VMN82_06340 [Thermoanaerobaculia bacterium]|nr:hypothetical protein [Thermoanaerobaculia bacterium]
MNEHSPDTDRHLSDAELFALAVPATGEPEAIPPHLSRCGACSRALRDWKVSFASLAEAETGQLGRRTDADWRAREDATLEAIRRAGRTSRSAHPWRWAVAVAASLLVAALLLPGLRRAPAARIAAAPPTPAAVAASPELAEDDAADDRLLREASFVAGGGDVDSGSGLEGRL